MEDGQQYIESSTPTKSYSTPLAIVVVLLLLGGYYYFSQKPNSMMKMPASSAPSTSVVDASPASIAATAEIVGDTKVFTLEGGSFYYKPNLIEVKKGDKVKVIINSVSMMHDFVIDDLGVKSEMAKSGSSTSVEFVADKVGSFEFYCSVGQHRAQGMVGTFVVAE